MDDVLSLDNSFLFFLINWIFIKTIYVNRLLKTSFLDILQKNILQSSLLKFNGRHRDLVDRYDKNVSQMKKDLFS